MHIPVMAALTTAKPRQPIVEADHEGIPFRRGRPCAPALPRRDHGTIQPQCVTPLKDRHSSRSGCPIPTPG